MALVGFGVTATWLGADEARRPGSARESAEAAMQAALERGSDSPPVREALRELRHAVGQQPLDWRTRAAYASLLLGVSQELDHTRAAAAHARQVARLAPVTVPAVRSAARILARTGDTEESLALVRDMFGYDPERASRLLASLLPFVGPQALEAGLAEDPDAWIAWAAELRRSGELDEAHRRAKRTLERWPQHYPALTWVAARALQRRDSSTLEAILPPELPLPDEPSAAPLLVLRAHGHATADPTAARADLARALRLAGDDRSVQIRAGEAYAALGDHDEARRLWRRALYALPDEETATRRTVLLYLARLEDGHGRPAAALRLWQQLAQLDPGHAEARRRIDDLTGFRR